jgi:hypothetical protein
MAGGWITMSESEWPTAARSSGANRSHVPRRFTRQEPYAPLQLYSRPHLQCGASYLFSPRLRMPLLCITLDPCPPSLSCRRKREARVPHLRSEQAQKSRGMRAKLLNQKRYKEKVQLKKT